jgi:predicted O-methyltransferase YrrM
MWVKWREPFGNPRYCCERKRCMIAWIKSNNSSEGLANLRLTLSTESCDMVDIINHVGVLMEALSNIPMKSSLNDPKVTELLDVLYADAAKSDALNRNMGRASNAAGKTEAEFYQAARKSYMAVGRDFGNLLYSLARSTKAKTVVEFGTSFGISTIFLASAIRDNGSGKVITTEFEAKKAEQAKRNLAAAGLEQWVEFRVGDALETLSDPPREIDMIFLDGAKSLYLGVLKLLQPQLRSGGIVASDNTDHNGMAAFLDYIRDCRNGYTSAAILTSGERGKAHEITVRH